MACSFQGSVVGSQGLLSITATLTIRFNPTQVVPTEVKRLPIKGLFGREGRRIRHTWDLSYRELRMSEYPNGDQAN